MGAAARRHSRQSHLTTESGETDGRRLHLRGIPEEVIEMYDDTAKERVGSNAGCSNILDFSTPHKDLLLATYMMVSC